MIYNILVLVVFSSLQLLSHVQLFPTPWTAAHQAFQSITNSQTYPNSRPLSQWYHPTISLASTLLLQSSIFPSIRVFSVSQLFTWGGQVLECQLQHQSFQWTPRTDLLQDGLVGSPCNPRDSQESSPTPQYKSINSSALSFLHSPTLTSIHDHWKNYSLD